MSEKFFPIKKGVACQLKWTWNTIRLQEGTSQSCHRVAPLFLTLENFDNFHNDEKWLEQRKLQLAGKFPQEGCQYCETIEKAGGISDRMTHLKIPNLYPLELDTDPESIHVTPRILEVFLDNTCNLRCIYCDESNSSRIEIENKKFGYIKEFGTSIAVPRHNDFDKLVEKFFTYLENNYKGLRRLHVLGGEPFYQKSFSRLVDFVKQNSNPDLELNIVTSLSISKSRLEEFVELMKKLLIQRKIGRLDITASLDCFGPEQEYVRYGLDLHQWKENFEYLVSQKWITLNVNSTITSLTIKTMPAMIEYFNNFRKQRKIHHSFGHVDGRPALHCHAFGAGFFDQEFAELLACLPEKTEWDQNIKDYMHGLHKSLSLCETDYTKINQLKKILTEIDRRRNLNYTKVFPWLNQYFLENQKYVV
jgi:pyruvate-formate lyase-activating enzyme